MSTKTKKPKKGGPKGAPKLTTKLNVQEAHPGLRMLYGAWDQFCDWYINGEHERGAKDTTYSVYVSRWKGEGGSYPAPKTILQALHDSGFATIVISIK